MVLWVVGIGRARYQTRALTQGTHRDKEDVVYNITYLNIDQLKLRDTETCETKQENKSVSIEYIYI